MQDISPQGGERPSFFLSRGQAVPPIQRCAAGGEKRPVLGREEWPPAAAGSAGVHRRECRRLAAETKGQRAPYGSRGHPVQGGGVPLRKAPLRSRVYPWSTKRPCGPLVFRRATEGRRVQRKGRGVKRGRETLVSLPLLPPPPGGGTPHAMSWRITPCPGGPLSPSAARLPSAEGKIFFIFPLDRFVLLYYYHSTT